jgi:hypothetical protein
LAIGGVVARPTIGGAGLLDHLWRSECTAGNGRGGGMWPGRGGVGSPAWWLGREEASAAACGGTTQAGKGGGVAPAAKGGAVIGGSGRADTLKTSELI